MFSVSVQVSDNKTNLSAKNKFNEDTVSKLVRMKLLTTSMKLANLLLNAIKTNQTLQ